MQLKNLLPSLLLLALRPESAFAASDDAKTEVPDAEPLRFVKANSVGISKRNPFALFMQPHYIAAPLMDTGMLSKRQTTCPGTASKCYTGCCPAETVCGIYGGEIGCCPDGKTCGSVSGCPKDSVTCSDDVCCLEGSVCTKDSMGKTVCGKDDGGDDDTGNGGCDPGYSACTIFQGCCPTGAECILPKNCNVPCGSDDPPCGPGSCCEKGSVCTDNFECIKGDDGTFTDLTRTSTTTFIRSTSTLTEEEPESTVEPEPTTTEDESSTETSTTTRDFFDDAAATTSTTTTSDEVTTTVSRLRITTTTTDNGNTAPTMGALIGNGLGVAAGLIGALVL